MSGNAGYMFVVESLRRMPKSMTLDDGLDRLEKLLEERVNYKGDEEEIISEYNACDETCPGYTELKGERK